ncbi:hypothetical protein P2318_18415 [Myxococcaceae bacterium GXIMD 01537]
MKNLTGALVFSLSLLFTTGCHKNTGESPDAATRGLTDSAQGAVHQGGSEGGRGAPSTTESCVDRWLAEHKLDRYGNPADTMYAGGTPLFNEATGESRDRLDYVFERQPDARAACARTDAGSEGR